MLTEEKILASWDRAGSGIDYWLAAHVDEDVVKAASAGRKFACAHLGVQPPTWRFYLPEGRENQRYRAKYGRADWPSFTAPEQNGHADLSTKTIGIRADIPPWLACEVASHEVAHLALPGRDRDADEEAATAYGEWAAEIVMPYGKLVDVHLFDGHPYDGYALAGVADHGDVVVANDDGKVGVFRNAGSRRRPEWLRHHATSPVDDEESSVRAGTA